MTKATPPKMFQIWSKRLMLALLKPGIHPDRKVIREKLVRYVDQRGLNLTDAAVLNTFENSEALKLQLNQLLTPRPGEKTNLEKILALLEVMVRTNNEILKGQAALGERLDAFELQITELTAFCMNRNSPADSTSS